MNHFSKQALIHWFLLNKRSFPWRETTNPYFIWISEVMLQQTRASVVIPFFLRWIERFPTIQSLAEASIEEVIKTWEGLGYYSRAKNLHQGAQQICAQSVSFPSNKVQLLQIKGIGPYTAGAILNFAFHQKEPAIDGNVLRVISRYYGIHDPIDRTSTVKKITNRVENLLPEKDSWIFSEALIELGAMVCTPAPKCSECPLQSTCVAFSTGNTTSLPIKEKKNIISTLKRIVGVIYTREGIFVRKVPEGELMSGLYEFPYWECTEPENPLEKFSVIMETMFTTNIFQQYTQKMPVVKHSFTRYRVILHPYFLDVRALKAEASFIFQEQFRNFIKISEQDLSKLPFPSGHRQIAQQVSSFFTNCI